MTDTAAMRWRVSSPTCETVALTKYAVDAARLAICAGAGARVWHGDRVVLTVDSDTAMTGALPIADAMIAAAHRRPAA